MPCSTGSGRISRDSTRPEVRVAQRVARAPAGPPFDAPGDRPLRTVIADANRLASGDLASSAPIHASGAADELRQALTQVSVNLRTVILDTRMGIACVRDAAREIAAGNQDLSSRTEAQASSLQQTAASMEQIANDVRSGRRRSAPRIPARHGRLDRALVRALSVAAPRDAARVRGRPVAPAACPGRPPRRRPRTPTACSSRRGRRRSPGCRRRRAGGARG